MLSHIQVFLVTTISRSKVLPGLRKQELSDLAKQSTSLLAKGWHSVILIPYIKLLDLIDPFQHDAARGRSEHQNPGKCTTSDN